MSFFATGFATLATLSSDYKAQSEANTIQFFGFFGIGGFLTVIFYMLCSLWNDFGKEKSFKFLKLPFSLLLNLIEEYYIPILYTIIMYVFLFELLNLF